MTKPIVRAIFKRDLRSWFGNPTGYVFIILFVFLSAAALVGPTQFFQSNLANLDTLNEWYRVLLLLFIPAVTMGIWASERSHGTNELLFTLPASDAQILLGKYLAAAGIYTAALLFTISLPIGLWFLGSPDYGLIFSNYVGYWLLGLMLISVSMVGSQLTENLTVSFILGALLCTMVMFSEEIISSVAPVLGRTWGSYGPNALFEEMGRGVISAASVLLFAAMTSAFLYLNLTLLSRRHWGRKENQGLHHGFRFASLVVVAISLGVIGINQLPRFDSTSEQIHSLSDETLSLLAELDPDRPVYVQAYISDEVPAEYVQTRRTLLNLLRQYDSIGGSAVEIRVVPTEKFTEEATEARNNFGIRAQQRVSEEGARLRSFDVFLGLAFQCGTEEVVLPFMDRKIPVEYEVTRSIRVVASSQRKKVGVLKTDADLFGGFDFQTMRQSPEWDIVRELKLQYEVQSVGPDEDYPTDMDVLMVPMASSLTQPQMDRLATYISAGNATLILDDPMPFSLPGLAPDEPKGGQQNPMMMGQQPPQEEKGDIESMLSAFNIKWQKSNIVWAAHNPHPDLELVQPEIVFVTENSGAPEPFNKDLSITSGLQEVITIFGGEVKPGDYASITFTPLMQAGFDSGLLAKQAAFRFNPFGGGAMLDPNRRFRVDNAAKILGCMVQGKPVDDADQPINLVFIPDIDFIGSDFFRIRSQGFGGTKIQLDNVTFILNCVDYLAKDESFIDLRKRRPLHRSLVTIEAKQEAYNATWLEEKKQAEEDAETALADAQARLDERVNQVRNDPELDARAKEIQIQ
ncbi:MAG: Gldg family protein, partial [Planctomycetota bacterium]